MRLPQSAEVLREGTFTRYLAAVTISNLGTTMAIVGLAFAVLEFGDASDLGVVIVAREVPMIILLLVGGVFADRLPRRSILIGCDVVKGLSQGATAIVLFAGVAEVWNVALLQVVYGLAAAFQRPAGTGMVREVASDEHLQPANAMVSLSRNVFSIVGPALGGLIVAAGSPATAVAVDAGTFFISAILLASIRLAPTVRGASASMLHDFREGWREFTSRTWVVAMVISFGLFQLTYFPAVIVLGPVVANDELGGPAVWGTILAAGSVGALLGGLFSLRLRFRRPLVASQLLVIPAGLFVLSLAAPAPALVVALASMASGFGFSMGGVLWDTALQRNVPEHALSRISSFDWLGSVALNPIGYILIGPIAEAIGTGPALVIAGLTNIAVCVGVVLIPSVRHIEIGPSPAVAPASTAAP